MCALVFSKYRAAPLRKVSIPRLELQAAVLSVRVCELVQREIEMSFSKIYYWTDSEVVLKYSWVSRDVINFTGVQLQIDTQSLEGINFSLYVLSLCMTASKRNFVRFALSSTV